MVEVVNGVVAGACDGGGTVAVVWWVTVQGQLVIVRVVAWFMLAKWFLTRQSWNSAHRGCGIGLIALNNGSCEWAVGGVGRDDLSCEEGRGRGSWARSRAVSPCCGGANEGGGGEDGRLHCDFRWFVLI